MLGGIHTSWIKLFKFSVSSMKTHKGLLRPHRDKQSETHGANLESTDKNLQKILQNTGLTTPAFLAPGLFVPNILVRINIPSITPTKLLDFFQLAAVRAAPQRHCAMSIFSHVIWLRQRYWHTNLQRSERIVCSKFNVKVNNEVQFIFCHFEMLR